MKKDEIIGCEATIEVIKRFRIVGKYRLNEIIVSNVCRY